MASLKRFVKYRGCEGRCSPSVFHSHITAPQKIIFIFDTCAV
ncbi:hypothetical protein [Macrococcus equipercicus]|nr:hypothetical protein [Macrococcus equipercicus]